MFDIWLALLELENFPPPQAVEGFHQQMVKHARLTWFDIDLHKACQLTCDHCFYNDNYPKSKSPGLAPELLEEAIRQAFQAQIKILTFSGMEPTLSRNFEWAVRCARMARARYAPAAKIGLITNGLTLPRHLQFLEKKPPDFIDISIDGWEAHNRIRSNTRERVVASLLQAKSRLPSTRVGTSTVLRNDNIFDVMTMIENLQEHSNYFYFEPVVAAVDKSVPALTEDNLIVFIKNLHRLAEKLRNRELHFSILLNGDQALPLFYQKLLHPEEIREDELHSLYLRQNFGEVQIDYILRLVPEYFWRSARLTYDGYWLGTCDLLQAPNYREVASGCFVETPDLLELFRGSLEHGSLFHQSLEDLFLRPCRHNERERQYCCRCFSSRMVQIMRRRYGYHQPIVAERGNTSAVHLD